MADSSWMYQPSRPSSGSPNAPGSQQPKPNLSVFRDSTSPTEPAGNKAAQPTHRIRRRNRVIASCLECRRRKLKCDKQAPCMNCTRFKRDCLYLAPAMDAQSQQKLAEIKERMGALEKGLEREVKEKSAKTHLGGANVLRHEAAGTKPEEGDEADDDLEEDDEALEPTPLAALDAGYEDNGDDEMMDLGVQMGKMRITDRIGGWIRPKLVDELNDTLRDVMAGKSRWSKSPLANDHRQLSTEPNKVKLQASPKSYIGPGPDYIAPASSFFFPGTNASTVLMDYLPSKDAADQLIAQYYRSVHEIAKIVHRPTLEAQYTLFWNNIVTGTEPLPSLQAILFAAMFSAAVSLTDGQAITRFNTSKAALVDSLRSGTEMALSKANFLRTTKVDTMQAFTMYLIPLVRAEVSRAHSALVGTAIRLAECMGLHRDGSHYNMTPIEIHVRRMIWHQLCFLDQRTCEATGPRPQIRKDDYDTKFPFNVDDLDLIDPSSPVEDRPYWTDNTLFRIRTELLEMRRLMWFDIIALDKKKKTLTSVLVRVQKWRASFEERWSQLVEGPEPVRVVTRHIIALGINGLYLTILHRYLFSTTTKMPDRLRQVLIESGLAQMENAIALETTPELAPWAWYKGAFNQYHSALLLMVEVYAYPMRKDAPRIWKCLDYIFDIPPHLSPKQKAELVITDLRDRMEIFHQMRKVRATTQMEARVSNMATRSSLAENQRTVQLVDELGQMNQQPSMPETILQKGMAPIPPATASGYGPPAMQPFDDSGTSPSQTGSAGQGAAAPGIAMPQTDTDLLMEDIDWNEWDKYFPLETNTGDLNIPDFDFNAFTGSTGFGSPAVGGPSVPTSYGSATAQPAAGGDMTDVNFGLTYYPDVQRFHGQNAGRGYQGG